jgi:CheY-like chemotaxis protein
MALEGTMNIAPSQPSDVASERVRVVLVDDTDDIRMLVRVTLEQDGRFAVVGEASDGIEAIELVGALQPDLVVLDRQMPRLGGVEALPELHARAPRSAVVLYTAQADDHTCQAALAAGAVGVVDKQIGAGLVQELAHVLVAHSAAPNADFEVRVGPVAARSARAWIPNTELIIAAVRAHPDVVDEPVAADVLDTFEEFLRTWRDIAEASDVFVWAGRATVDEVRRLVEAWAVIDRIPDGALAAIGCSWSPPEGVPFFEALTGAMLDALGAHEATGRLAERLNRQWRPASND